MGEHRTWSNASPREVCNWFISDIISPNLPPTLSCLCLSLFTPCGAQATKVQPLVLVAVAGNRYVGDWCAGRSMVGGLFPPGRFGSQWRAAQNSVTPGQRGSGEAWRANHPLSGLNWLQKPYEVGTKSHLSWVRRTSSRRLVWRIVVKTERKLRGRPLSLPPRI